MRWPSLVVLLLFAAAPAHANKVKARDFFRRGMAEYVLEHWDLALSQFEEGFKEEPEPAFLYNMAQAHAHAGRPAEAMSFYRKYLEMAPDAPDRAAVEKRIAELQPRLEPAPVIAAPQQPAPVLLPTVAPPPPTTPQLVTAPAPVEKHWSRRDKAWLGVGIGAVVFVAAAITITVVATRPSETVLTTEMNNK